MKKQSKGFTLVELLAVIVILAVIILIAVNAVLPQMNKARRNSFSDEALNFAKAAETAYVDGAMTGTSKATYTVSELKGEFVTKNDENYVGKVTLSFDANNNVSSKTVWLTDCKNYMIVGEDTRNITGNIVKKFKTSGTGTVWDETTMGACPSNSPQDNND